MKSRRSQFVPDEYQRQAIEHVHGPALVVAGAGTGKTSVLTQRIARLVREGHAHPGEVLALTYTNNAAGEMREKVRALLGGKDVRAFTFHDYCNGLLKQASKDFGVLDETDLRIYLRRRIRELRLEHYVRAANVTQFLRDLLEFVSRCHDELITPEKYQEYVERVARGELPIPRVAKSSETLSDAEVLGRCREISRVFATLERWLAEENYGSFSHMITQAYALLRDDNYVLEQERGRTRFILVDEFQDANFAQVKLLSLLAGEAANVFAVGDPDQAIYRFRGASSAAFQLFFRQFPETHLVSLSRNRRSTTPILQCAFAVIDQNPQVFGGRDQEAISYRRRPLESAREDEAARENRPLATSPVEAVTFTTREAEASDVVRTIEDLRRRLRCGWSDFGILYRSHGQRDEVVLELAGRDIPFSIESMDVSDTPEVRDLFACLAVTVDLSDDVSLFRVAALPHFDVDPIQLRAALRAIAADAKEGQVIPLAKVLDSVEGGDAVMQTVLQARDVVAGLKGRFAVEALARHFRLDTSSSLLQAAFKFVGDWEGKPTTKTKELPELVEHLGYFREAEGVIPMASRDDEDAVRLMTVHGAKGLEFPHVFVLRAAKGSFPANYRETLVEFPPELRDPDSAGEDDDKTHFDQEERRLFYVAMTRARDTLHLNGKQGIGKDKTPPGPMRDLIKDATLRTWLRSRPALPSQPELLELSAAADPAYPQGSRTSEWLELPPSEGLASRLSASAVDTYERCPLQFKLERDWKLSREVAAAMQYGASIHRVLRTYYDSIKLGRPKSEEELLELFRADLAETGIQDPYQQELYEKQGIAQLRDFLAAAQATPVQVKHTEEWFEVQIAGVKVVGRIDRIDHAPNDGVVVVDYKTGKARSQEDADESLQLSIYAMAAKEKWGYKVDSLVFHNLQENVPVVTRRTEFQLAEARERVEAAARGIAEGKFEAKPEFYCSFCSFRKLCPAKEKRIPNLAKRQAANDA